MERALRYKTLFLLFLIALSVASLLPTVVPDQSLPSWYGRVFASRLKLGLDLQGGVHLVYGIDLDRVVEDKATEIKHDLDAVVAEKKIDAVVETPRPNPSAGIPVGAIIVTPKNPADKSKLGESFFADFESLVPMDCPADRAGAVCHRVDSEVAEAWRESAIDQAIKTITDRVNGSGLAEVNPQKKGEEIIVELPGSNEADNERLRSIINRTAKLEFKMVDDGNPQMAKLAARVRDDAEAKRRGITVESDPWQHEESGAQHSDYFLQAKDRIEFLTAEESEKRGCPTRGKTPVDGKYECVVSGRVIIEEYLATLPPDLKADDSHEIGFEEQQPRTSTLTAMRENTWRTYYLKRAVEIGGTMIDSAEKSWDPTTGMPNVIIKFNRAGSRRFADLTTKNVGRKMAIILDEKVNSAPVIQGPITGGTCTITLGRGDARAIDREAQDLVNVLRTGALPAPLVERQSSTVGALLGADAIERAKLSMIVGAILVVLVMLYFYKVSGMIANVAMVLNVLFQVAILAGFNAALTLPGIAGLVLTVGMAVDANIIIYARIRDELRHGKTVRAAVDAGFGRAFWTVFDAHVTTFVAGFVLMQYGTGPIKGFAVTLIIGVVCNLFTSTWVSRLMFDHYVSRRRDANAMISI